MFFYLYFFQISRSNLHKNDFILKLPLLKKKKSLLSTIFIRFDESKKNKYRCQEAYKLIKLDYSSNLTSFLSEFPSPGEAFSHLISFDVSLRIWYCSV